MQTVLRRSISTAAERSRVVFVEGQRTPFLLAGTNFANYIAQDLGRFALKGLVTKTAIDPKIVDYLVMGTVIQEAKTSNIARESSLGAGLPQGIPAHTVTMACISANQAVATVAATINSGQHEIGIAGGAETMSDVPIRFSREVRKRMIKSQKAKGLPDYLKLLSGLKLAHLAPELPAIAEFSTGEVMGHSSDRLASTWGVSRQSQDEFALRSHSLAAKAHKDGLLKDEIYAVDGISVDNTFKEATIEKLSSLRPAFIKPHGTHTAGNSSALTDGASAALLMSEEAAKKYGFTPKTRILDHIFVAQDPKDELLLGPAYAVAKLMHRNQLSIADVSVWEFHEAFAGQVLANLNALDSDVFAQKNLGRGAGAAKVGRVPFEKLNTLGGSLSLGHPFGATGTRLLTTTSNRLQREGGRYGILAACAAGGLGHAMLVERYTPRA